MIVKSSPLSGFTFSQLKATIAGNVQCIRNADCASLQVVLRTEAHNDITIDLIGGFLQPTQVPNSNGVL